MMAVTMSTATASEVSPWIRVDIGAPDHFSPYRGQFDSFQELTGPAEVETAQGKTHATGIGNITVEAYICQRQHGQQDHAE
jgi:hypothetical protein